MSTVSDYIGRKVDLVFLHGDSPTGDVLLTQGFVTPDIPSGAVVTGIKKLVQRFLLEFMTERGSMRFLPNRGTEFMTLVREGYLRTQLDVFQAFSQAEVLVRRNLRLEESDDDPDDERYGTSDLDNVAFGDRLIALDISITSLGGSGVGFIFPLEIPVIR